MTNFLLTYGDGVGNIDINASIASHRQIRQSLHDDRRASARPFRRTGDGVRRTQSRVSTKSRRPRAGYINGGFMVCSRTLFQLLPDDPEIMLEQAAAEVAWLPTGSWPPIATRASGSRWIPSRNSPC